MASPFKIGFGFDVHPLADGELLFLGGCSLISQKSAVGHSDADVLIHAICDALLGAANLRDIGFHFSNNDERWKGVRSTVFLTQVASLLRTHNFLVSNIDSTVCLESPKINPHIPSMQEAIGLGLGISPLDISIKATTNERLGFIGREEGITAYAVALIYRQ